MQKIKLLPVELELLSLITNQLKYLTTPWKLKQNRKGNSKINDSIKKYIYNWIIHHPQVVQSPIFNDCLKVKIDGHTEPQLVPILLLQVSIRKLYNNLFSGTDYGEIKEARDEENNIIISDSILRSLLPPQFKKIRQGTRSCLVTNVAYLPRVYIPHCYHGVIVI